MSMVFKQSAEQVGRKCTRSESDKMRSGRVGNKAKKGHKLDKLVERLGVALPSDCSTDKAKEEFLVDELRKGCIKVDFNSTRQEIALGCRLLVLAELVKIRGGRKKEAWGKALESIGMEPRTAQRRMRLARHVDIKNHPGLAYLGQNRLLDAIRLKGKKQSLTKFFEDNNIDIVDKPKSVRKLKRVVDDLLLGLTRAVGDDSLDRQVEEAVQCIKKTVSNAIRMNDIWRSVVGDYNLSGQFPVRDADDLTNKLQVAMRKIRATIAKLIRLKAGIEDSSSSSK